MVKHDRHIGTKLDADRKYLKRLNADFSVLLKVGKAPESSISGPLNSTYS